MGTGTDTVVFATSANATTASATAAFNANFLSVEAISVAAALTTTIDAAALGGATSFSLNGDNTAGIINSLASGSTVTLNDPSTTVTANISNAVVSTGDVLNVVLSNDTATANAFGTVTSAGTETVNITMTDAGTVNNVVATTDTATLVATSATTINVSGNNGLTLTTAGNTAVTTFDASGVVADTATSDSAALLAVTYASANVTATAAVSITGGAGNDEGLQPPRRHKKRKWLYHKDSSIIRLWPTHPNHIWAIDFVHDKLSNGHSYKMFTVLDEYTREALCVAVRPKMNANDVLETLHPLLIKHGKPEFIHSDNGPEFIAMHLQDWLKKVGIKPMQIYQGSPWENGYNERFNGTLRKEVLNTEWFHTTRQAQVAINVWLRQYNQIRPHHALNRRPPAPETLLEKPKINGPI